MSYVVSFTDFEPVPRFDDNSWTHAQIEESATETGVYTIIDTVALPSDSDPAHPAARSFTTTAATMPSAWYRITFIDNFGGKSPVAPVSAAAVAEASVLPTVRDVALEILSRTRDSFGNLAGTFTVATTPSDSDVLDIIYRTAPLIADAIGDDVPEELWDDAKKIIAMRAAMQVEVSFFSDQVNTGRSVYPQLEKQYETELARLVKQATLLEESGSLTPIDVGAANKAAMKFPKCNDRIMTRRM